MFAVIYRFRVKPGLDHEFQQAWSSRTAEIRVKHSSLGSRLHKAGDGSYIAYAQWQDRQRWQSAFANNDAAPTPAQQALKESCESVETLHELELVEDLLLPLFQGL